MTDTLRPLCWEDVENVLPEGGTFIGTARCAEMMTKEGRRIAVRNCLKRNIDRYFPNFFHFRLIVCGGDGSLTGASVLYKEWDEHVKKIIEEDKNKKTGLNVQQNDP